MKDFLVLFREPDGRKEVPSAEFQASHERHWKAWIGKMSESGKLAGGNSLTLNGSVVKNAGKDVLNGPHRVGKRS